MRSIATSPYGNAPVVAFRLTLVIILPLLLCSAVASDDTSTATLIIVDKSGGGDAKKIQDAIDMVPLDNSETVFILVKPGIYNEKVEVPKNKPHVILSGTDAKSTIIRWKGPWIDMHSATLSVYGEDFMGRHLTIENTYGQGRAAIAVQVQADRVAFYSCRMLSYQDTLLDDKGRHYYKNCYIQGATDFICGNGLALFEKCHIQSISSVGGAITAQRRTEASENTGYSFLNCKVTGNGTLLLGRPWGHYSRVVFAHSYMSDAVLPSGWDDWRDSSNHRTAYYGEYKCYGPGSDTSERVQWSRKLSQEEARYFTSLSMIDGEEWLRPLPKHFRRFSATLH